jgi:hypothetical protein
MDENNAAHSRVISVDFVGIAEGVVIHLHNLYETHNRASETLVIADRETVIICEGFDPSILKSVVSHYDLTFLCQTFWLVLPGDF